MTETIKIGAKSDSDLRIAGSLFLFAGILFYLVNMMAESIYPNYNDGSNYLSDLGARSAPSMLLWDSMLFTFGIIFIASTHFYLRRTGNKLMMVTFIISGIGTIIVSLFPENSILAVHTVGAEAAFLFGGISAMLAYRVTRPPFRYFVLILGIITLASDFLLFIGIYFGLGVGGMERMVVYPEMAFLMALGGYLLNSHSLSAQDQSSSERDRLC